MRDDVARLAAEGAVAVIAADAQAHGAQLRRHRLGDRGLATRGAGYACQLQELGEHALGIDHINALEEDLNH